MPSASKIKGWEIGTAYNTPGLDSRGHNWSLFVFYGEGVIAEVRGQTPEQAIERARLIAAAPDLLEALQDVIDALLMGPIDIAAKYGPDFNPDDVLLEPARKARAALALAAGGK